jgi:hypothetical protein
VTKLRRDSRKTGRTFRQDEQDLQDKSFQFLSFPNPVNPVNPVKKPEQSPASTENQSCPITPNHGQSRSITVNHTFKKIKNHVVPTKVEKFAVSVAAASRR